jgi:hypothetical protein
MSFTELFVVLIIRKLFPTLAIAHKISSWPPPIAFPDSIGPHQLGKARGFHRALSCCFGSTGGLLLHPQSPAHYSPPRYPLSQPKTAQCRQSRRQRPRFPSRSWQWICPQAADTWEVGSPVGFASRRLASTRLALSSRRVSRTQGHRNQPET